MNDNHPSKLKSFRSPQTVIARFVAGQTVKTAAFWALIFGFYVASKSLGFATAYPTAAGRAHLVSSLGSNIGLIAILGKPQLVSTVKGWAAWNTLLVVTVVGAIWGLLLATKRFRGEEAMGRWEILLSGLTTPRKAAVNVLAGLGFSFAVLLAITSVSFIVIGRIHTVDFSVSSALFFALASVLGAAEFLAIGSLASQLMPTRSRAASLAAAIFGISFIIRASGDISSYHWLLNISPLGWIENLQPLSHSQPIWLIPIFSMITLLLLLTVILAGSRDLGAATFPDKDTSRPHFGLLNSTFASSVRLARTSIISWLIAGMGIAYFFAILTRTAAQAFQASLSAEKVLSRLAQVSQDFGAKTFLGIIFFFLMILFMAYSASALGAIREDEASGYLDNIIVRPIGRLRWIGDRILLLISSLVLIGTLSSLTVWIGSHGQTGGISLQIFLSAGINSLIPAIFIAGLGILALGFWPRFCSTITFGVLAWSFLLEMVSSGINLNHWIADTSILHHILLAPASSPNWHGDLIITCISLVLALFGIWKFNIRDLASE
ncbi:MAG: hypothetical protein ACHQUB_00220 [Candidatus Saccharimonadia bacterium]